ncbi:MAG: hypothetical protein ACTSRI_11645 [Promethearchaeota archaeon]
MFFNEIIATTLDEVGISWFDFFSVGHVIFGIGTFLILSLFYTIPKNKGYTPIFSLLFVFICTLVILILWEFLENIIFIELGMKFEGRADSWQNILTDILLGVIGALCTWLFAYLIFEKDKNIWGYYLFGITSFIIWLIFFFVLRYFTYWYTTSIIS